MDLDVLLTILRLEIGLVSLELPREISNFNTCLIIENKLSFRYKHIFFRTEFRLNNKCQLIN